MIVADRVVFSIPTAVLDSHLDRWYPPAVDRAALRHIGPMGATVEVTNQTHGRTVARWNRLAVDRLVDDLHFQVVSRLYAGGVDDAAVRRSLRHARVALSELDRAEVAQ